MRDERSGGVNHTKQSGGMDIQTEEVLPRTHVYDHLEIVVSLESGLEHLMPMRLLDPFRLTNLFALNKLRSMNIDLQIPR